MNESDKNTSLFIRRALLLEYTTIGWNIIEGVIAISSGTAAGSIALIGFGLDSFIEVTAAGALIWRLKKQGSLDEELDAEKRALQIVGITFFALAAYVIYESIHTLWIKEAPQVSLIGIVLALVSSILMPILGLTKRKVAVQINSRALAADAVETFVCAWLSIILLIGLGVNALWGWWWADPAAGLIMAGFIIREGIEAIEESRE